MARSGLAFPLAVLVPFVARPLPVTARLCYKPDMRKWMRERLKRRKKNTEEAGTSAPAAVPLQPKYFESTDATDTSGPGSDEGGPERSSAEAESGSAEPQPSAQPGAAQDEGSQRRGRRRRRRGGRGRGSQAAPAAEQPAPVADQSPAPVAPAHVRSPKGLVVLAIGLPGSGKSSWFKRHSITPLSSDLLRSLLFDDPTEQRFQDLVFSNLRSMLRARLIARRPANYVDATNLSPQERASWIKLAHDYEYETQAVFFDVPVEVCLERNQRRERSVPEEVMRRMAAKLRPPTFEEGFSKITVVKVKRKDNEPAE